LPRHFLTGSELSADELLALLDRAAQLKAAPHSSDALRDRIVALVFQKASTRTRVSFEAGIVELGGHPMILRPDEMQLSRGESVRDTALVLSRHVDAIGVRTGPDALLEELAAEGTIPVFNMLTAGHHPCQALADLLTLREAFGRLDGLKLAYVGDGNNVARSLVVLGGLAGVEVVVSSPPGYELEGVETVTDPARAVRGALPHRRRPARPRRARRHRAALPARASGRGDHGRGALRLPPAHLGRGREPPPRAEGAAGMAARYDRIGRTYTATRGTDPRIAARIWDALGDARTVVNVGAGTGSYEPPDRDITAAEPSAVMIAQRPPGAAPAVQASAEALPFADASFDAAMAVLTLHHWSDLRAGCAELRRVARDRVVVFSWDPTFVGRMWLGPEYFPRCAREDAAGFPSLADQAAALGDAAVEAVPIPWDCRDGFFSAFWRRPAAYLDPAVRAGISTLAKRSDDELAEGLARLRADLDSGAWARRHADLLERDELDLGYRLLVGPGGR
jgi:SAM-dependent methyltransferase